MDITEQDISFPIRINKLLSALGVCSRREADRLIEEDRVIINGNAAGPGDKVEEGDSISIDGRTVELKRKVAPVLLAFNKPRGIVCTSSHKDRAENVIEYIGYPRHIFPVGRLDKDSEGLLLLTDMGELVNRINRAENHHEKEYQVTVDRDIDESFIEELKMGVMIDVPDRGRVRASCLEARLTGRRSFDIILTEGMNRQIRRMCEALGKRVLKLRRIRIMNIRLGSLKTGQYRSVEGDELAKLLKEL
ncbi:MAG TPA: pseudouridine synthase [Candidatus Avilachnospira avistercoris]|nr:pseudouridine synthase [Candidatus Avilachnospira avistercoris]